MSIELSIEGNIPVKKNKQRRGQHGGIYKHADVRAYEEIFAWEAIRQRPQPVRGPFAISGTFRLKSTKDVDGTLTTILDCLQQCELIDNDKMLTVIRDVRKVVISAKEVESVKILVEPVLA